MNEKNCSKLLLRGRVLVSEWGQTLKLFIFQYWYFSEYSVTFSVIDYTGIAYVFTDYTRSFHEQLNVSVTL